MKGFSFVSSRARNASTVPAAPQGAVGVVIAGGAASRFGADKASYLLAGEALAARAARRLGAVCREVVVADAGRGLLGEAFRSLPDGLARGPAAGILGVEAAYPGRTLLVLACDLPLVPIELLAELLAIPDDLDLVLPRWARGVEPLCARYGPRALAALAKDAERGDFSLRRLIERDDLDVGFLEGAALERWGGPAEIFWNVNEPSDLTSLAGRSLP